jgi:hypothetical protein
MGELGITWEEWETCPPEYYQYKLVGQREQSQAKSKEQYEIMRTLAYTFASPYLKDKCTVQQFMPFSWDKKEIDIREFTKKNQALYEKLTPDIKK